MSKNIKTNLGTERIGKLLLKLAIPAVTAQIVNVLYSLVDRIYIGRIPETGALALTGLGVCMPLLIIISAFAVLAGGGGGPRASIMMGRGKPEEAEKILGNCAVVLVVISAVLTAVILVFARDLLMLFGASENTVEYALDYLRIYTIGTIFVQITLGLNIFITAQGFSKISMLTVLIGAVCNIILDPIFIFALNMGVKGAAIATVISQAVSTTWVIIFLCSSKPTIRLRLKNLRLSPKVILPCLALGLSPFVMQFTESIINICFNSSLLKYGGDLAVGAMSILATVMQFFMLPLVGLTQGAQPIISYNYGAGNASRVKKTFLLTLIISLSYTFILWLLAMTVPKIFGMMFTSDPDLIAYVSWAMRIYMAASLLFGILTACQQTMVAMGKAKITLFLSIFRKVIMLIPLIYILPLFVPNHALGVFLAEPIADAAGITATIILFLIFFPKTLKALENESKNKIAPTECTDNISAEQQEIHTDCTDISQREESLAP